MIKWTKVLALATIALAIGTVALVGTAIWAILATERQSNIAAMSEIDATKQNAIAALQQQDTREQLRAVMGLNAVGGFPAVEPTTRLPGFVIFTNYQNYGGTRTGRFFAWTSVKYFDKELPNNFDFSKPFTKTSMSDVIVAPGAPYTVSRFISKDEVDKMVAKDGVIIVWGEAGFTDIFNPDTVHYIRMCLNVDVTVANNQYLFHSSKLKDECNNS